MRHAIFSLQSRGLRPMRTHTSKERALAQAKSRYHTHSKKNHKYNIIYVSLSLSLSELWPKMATRYRKKVGRLTDIIKNVMTIKFYVSI